MQGAAIGRVSIAARLTTITCVRPERIGGHTPPYRARSGSASAKRQRGAHGAAAAAFKD
jgi:hypothetical protein